MVVALICIFLCVHSFASGMSLLLHKLLANMGIIGLVVNHTISGV